MVPSYDPLPYVKSSEVWARGFYGVYQGYTRVPQFRARNFVVLYCNFRSLAFLGSLGFLRRQLTI